METASEFYFDEHVLKMTPEIIKKRLKGDIFMRVSRKLKGKNLDDLVNEQLKEFNRDYESYKNYFENIRNEKYCEMKYVVSAHNWHTLYLKEGTGIEIFDINGSPDFKKDDDRLETRLHVKKRR